jgi:amine oxidase (flavin-containing)
MKIGIIGAGYTGLTIAKELVENGQDVTIFEKQPYVGGMVNTIEIFNTRLEKYYRHIFKSDKEAIKLIKEMGLKSELIWPATKMGYLSNKKPYLFGTPISLLKFKPLNLIQKLRFGFNVIHIKLINDYKKLEKVTAEKWLKDRIGDKVYSQVWEPLLISKFGEEKDQISMAWLWGKIKLRSTSSTPEGEQLGYIKGSYQKLTDNFYKYLLNKNVDIKLETSVKEITKENDKYIVKYTRNEKEEKEEFDVIVSTIDYKGFEKLFDKYMNEEEKQKIQKVNYTSARTMMIVANKSFSPFYWLNIGDNDIPFGGIIEHTNFIDKSNYDNNHILYISNYMIEDNKLYNVSKEELLKEYMKSLTKINKEFTMKNIKDYYVFDEKYAQPIIECNYSEYIMNDKLEKEKIYLCTMPQIYPEDRGMNYAIKSGVNLANKILEENK